MSLSDSLLLDAARLDVWIALRTDGVKGSGTESDPYDGSTAGKFDVLMHSLPANTAVHIGPGVFETRGSAGWQPKSGQRIVGSGMDVTVLRLVEAGHPESGVQGGWRWRFPDWLRGFRFYRRLQLGWPASSGGSRFRTGGLQCRWRHWAGHALPADSSHQLRHAHISH